MALNNDKFAKRLDLGAKPKQPRFPLSAFPYLRGVRGMDEQSEDDVPEGRGGDETAAEGTAAEATVAGDRCRGSSGNEEPQVPDGDSRRPAQELNLGSMTDLNQAAAIEARNKYVNRQQKVLEKYLQEMIHWLMFRADSNRLLPFPGAIRPSACGSPLRAATTARSAFFTFNLPRASTSAAS